MPMHVASTEERWSALVTAAERMATAPTLEAVIDILRETARVVVGSPGISVVLREGALCHYAAEDSDEPLWQGQRFEAETCVSGWSMIRGETATIPDIRRDPRIPQAAYAATFVRSMVMVPIGKPEAVAAVGAYWGEPREHPPEDVQRLEALARFAATAIEATRRRRELQSLAETLERRVTARGRELHAAQEALRQSQKLEAIGQLTGGIAHDFNNLLTPIMGGLDMLRRSGVGGEREKRWIEAAAQSADRARTLVQRLLAYARRQPLDPGPVDVAKLVAGARDLLVSTLGRGHELVIEGADQLPYALADVHELEGVMLNLVLNARDAMPAPGRVTIATSVATVGAGQRADLKPGRYVKLAVIDTGAGMDDETKRRALEPFFSTKGAGKGTGLGLPMVQGLVSQLGGALTLVSELGRGTMVELWLPVSDDRPVTEAKAAAPAAIKIEGAVLVVDDEDLVRANTADMLADLGFQVFQAAGAREALEVLDAQSEVTLLMTDSLMPGMSGADLAATAMGRRPGLKVLMMSGFSETDASAPAVNRLKKPFRRAELEASLGIVLG